MIFGILERHIQVFLSFRNGLEVVLHLEALQVLDDSSKFQVLVEVDQFLGVIQWGKSHRGVSLATEGNIREVQACIRKTNRSAASHVVCDRSRLTKERYCGWGGISQLGPILVVIPRMIG